MFRLPLDCLTFLSAHFCMRIYSNSQYVQNDGVSRGSPLGPTFADFYMCHLENKLLKQIEKKSNPLVYLRNVDHIFAILKSHSHIRFF